MASITSRIRTTLASLASLAIAARIYLLLGSWRSGVQDIFQGLTLAVPVVAGLLIWSRRLPAQLLARGAWWAMLLFAAILSITSPSYGRSLGAFVAACCAIALLAAGGRGLDNRGRFAPVAFRGTLLVALVLAMADAGAFAWFGLGNAIFEHSYSVIVIVPLMVAGVVGLLQLRTWGLVVGLVANLTIVILAATGVLNLPSPLRQLFIGSAALQMVVPLPMIVSILRGRAPRPDAWRRTKAIVPAVVVLAIAALCLYACLLHHGPLLRM